MDNRKFEADAIASPPTAPTSPSSGYPTNGDPGAGQNATEPGAWWFHAVGEEIREVIEAAGLTPDHADLTQLRVAIDALIDANIVTVPDASETVKGIGEIATDAEAQSGTANKLIDGAKLHASSLGLGQTWQDVTGSRAAATTYTNSTGRPIQVLISFNDTGGTASFTITVGGVAIINTFQYDAATSVGNEIASFIVPNGQTYILTVSSATIDTWAELR